MNAQNAAQFANPAPNILILSCNIHYHARLRSIVMPFGIKTYEAISIQAAMQRLKQTAFIAVISDLTLGQFDAFRLGTLLRVHTQILPLIVVADVNNTQEDAIYQLCRQFGADYFIPYQKQDKLLPEIIAYLRNSTTPYTFPQRPPVLVIDDTPLKVEMVKRALGCDYTIEAVRDSQTALKCLAQKNYVFIILDLVLPGMQGGDLLKLITAHYPKQRIIILTAHDHPPKDKLEFILNGALDYILLSNTKDLYQTCQNILFYETLMQSYHAQPTTLPTPPRL